MSGEHSPRAGGRKTLGELALARTGANPLNCYQCGRCAAGCFQNIPGEMELSPTRIMRLLQLEAAFIDEPERADKYAEQALGADTPWLCAGCLACTTRCPQNVDIAGTMDTLRQISLERGLASRSKRARDIQALHKAFLSTALSRGRTHELSMIIGYKMRSGHWLTDALLGPAMLRRGKLKFFGGEKPGAERVKAAADSLKRQEGPKEE